MPSFFSKVFGRKKQDERDDRDSPLGGPYENISPSVSPSAANFPELVTNGGLKEKDFGFNLFKSKSRTVAAESHQKPDVAPHLALNLPSSLSQPEDSPTRALDVVFEADFDARVLLTDAAIGERRLSPTETLVLLRICARSIASRGKFLTLLPRLFDRRFLGLETLGIMHPHWYSASPKVQRKLISLYLHSLAAKSPSNTLSPSSSAILSTFESEIEYVRSPHDVAAVIRWALRHLKLDSNCFGREHDWYKAFFDEERAADYTPKAFSDYLSPRVPNTHLDLLCATFEIFSSLAAHAEANGISGSKLAKYFGLWLLTSHRAEESDNWSTFYARWERTGRMLEHLFLARLRWVYLFIYFLATVLTSIYRDEAVNHRMPVRLMELVNKYPYGSPASDDDLLPRPRFSTRQYDAVLVRVETQLTTQRKPKHSANKLISDAFEAEIVAQEQECKELWDQIKNKRDNYVGESPTSDGPDFSRVFADETIRFLSLLPDEEPGSPTCSLFKQSNRKRSLSLNDQDLSTPPSPTSNNGTAWHAKVSTDPAKVTTITPINRSGTRDWTQFSTSGFAESGTIGTRLAATLMEKDLEISIPPVSAPGKYSRFATNPNTNRRSMENPGGLKAMAAKEEQSLTSSIKVAQFSSVQIDEAFIDFWGDALTDPISRNWPPFVLCKLKSDVGLKTKSGKAVDWLVIERSYLKAAIPEPQSPDGISEYGSRRATSPRPSIASQGTFSSAKKRFSIFNTSGSRTSLDKRFAVPGRKKANSLSNAQQKALRTTPSSVRVGEMGEVLREEDEKETPKARPPSLRPKKSLDPTKTSVSGETGPVPPLPCAPASGKEDVQSSTQGGVTKPELVTTTTAAVVAAIGATVVTASDPSSTTEGAPEPVSAPVDQQTPSSAVISAEVSVPQEAPAAVPAIESLETVAEVAEEPAVPQTSSTQPQEVVQEEVTEAEAVVEPTPPLTVEEETSPAIQPISTTAVEDETSSIVEPTSSSAVEEGTSPAVEPTPSTAVEEKVPVTVEPTSFLTEEAALADDEPAAPVATEEETETTAVETADDTTPTVDKSTPDSETAPIAEDASVDSEPTQPAIESEVAVEAEQVNIDKAFAEPAAEVAPTVEEPKAEEGPKDPPSEDLTRQETKVTVEENGHAGAAVPRED